MKNKRFGKLVGLSYEYTGKEGAYWIFKCDCGNEKVINGASVRRGATTSCGCYGDERRVETHTKHGMANTRTYNVWVGIKQRCLNPKNDSYENYGGRGITIPEKWMDFQGFYEDMGEAPKGRSIERVNNDESYSKENCIWADRSTQNINKNYVNKTTGIRNISYSEKMKAYEVGFSRNKKRYRKTFKTLEDAIEWKEYMLEKLNN